MKKLDQISNTYMIDCEEFNKMKQKSSIQSSLWKLNRSNSKHSQSITSNKIKKIINKYKRRSSIKISNTYIAKSSTKSTNVSKYQLFFRNKKRKKSSEWNFYKVELVPDCATWLDGSEKKRRWKWESELGLCTMEEESWGRRRLWIFWRLTKNKKEELGWKRTESSAVPTFNASVSLRQCLQYI